MGEQLTVSGEQWKEHPILFQTETVKAILEGRKTQTRRTKGLEHVPLQDFSHVEYSPEYWVKRPWIFRNKIESNPDRFEIKAAAKCPYGEPGDLLWVRESFYEPVSEALKAKYFFKADLESQGWKFKWKPSIHMPKAASRIWAMIEDIRVERVQDISEGDARSEGVKRGSWPSEESWGYLGFNDLWCSINGLDSWDSNPWVWVIKFRVLSTTGRPSDEVIEKNLCELRASAVNKSDIK